MGRRRPIPELQKVKNIDGSPVLMATETESLKKKNVLEQPRPNSNRMVTRARGKRLLPKSVSPRIIKEAPKATDEALRKTSCVITPKMFFSKSSEKGARKSTKLSQNEPRFIPPVKKSKKSTVITENKPATSKQTLPRATGIKAKGHMTTQEVINELTNDESPKKRVLLPRNGKDPADKVNSDKDVNSSAGKFRLAGNKKQKMRLSLADIVMEIFPDSPEKKSPDHDVISNVSRKKGSAAKHPSTKKDQQRKVSNEEWDHSLLLLTDDFNSSGNIYDFEEFQMDSKSSSDTKSSSNKSDKRQSIKKTAAMKVVFNGKIKLTKERTSQKRIKKGNVKTTKIKSVKVVKKKPIPAVPVHKHAAERRVSVESRLSPDKTGRLSVSSDLFQTPTVQVLKEAVSITELEKLKATKHIENKIVSKVNPGLLSPDWPQLPDLPSQQFVKLKRAAMEGPTAADNLTENKPRSMLIKTSSAFNQSVLDMSSVDSESGAKSPKPAKAYCKLPENRSPDDHRPIDLFTYPKALPIKKPTSKIKKNDKRKDVIETPCKLMDFMYPGSIERFVNKPIVYETFKSPPTQMLPKYLHAATSTPITAESSHWLLPDSLDKESMSISPVKDFQSPSSMRTYEHKSRRSSSAFLSITKNVTIFADEPKENLMKKETKKSNAKKKNGHSKKASKKFDEWASKLSNEFDEIENFELSIEN